MRINGAKGAASLLALNRAIEREPQKWSPHVDAAAFSELGCDVAGMPWSMTLYGRQRIRFRRLEDHERFGEMLASLHALHRSQQYDLLVARIGQFLKATRQSVNANGPWRLAWLITGLPDPRPRAGQAARGLARPAEFAASVACLRETEALESALKMGGGEGGKDGGQEKNRYWDKKLKKWVNKKDQEGEGAGWGGA